MNRVVLQIPMDFKMKQAAEKEALAQGFSSLQAAVRLFLVQLGKRTIDSTFLSATQLPKKNE